MTQRRNQTYDGYCSVCGNESVFKDMSQSIRETYQCVTCRASLRERVTADGILNSFGCARYLSLAMLVKDEAFQALDIFEPGISGAYRSYFSGLPSYTTSFFLEDLQPGEMRNGIRSEDLMNLSFSDASFDLVISSDILEHVRHPWKAFEELRRVLRPGGLHIFSIPILTPIRPTTRYRVDTSNNEDVHILEPHYHGDGRGGKSLVYVDYGADLFDKLAECGFRTFNVRSDHTDAERRRVNALVTIAV